MVSPGYQGCPSVLRFHLVSGMMPCFCPASPIVMDLAKPELARRLGKAIDPDAIHRVVEIDVAGLLDRLVQIDRAVALPAAEIVTPEGKTAGTGHALFGGDDAGLEPCERGHDLEGRAGGILTAERAILERMIHILGELLPLREIDVEGDLVGIEGGIGRHDDDPAGHDVEHDDGGDAQALDALMSDFLQLLIDGENEVLAARACRRAKLADDAPVGVDLVADGSGFAPELRVQTLFDPGLSGAKSRHPHHRVRVDLPLVGQADIADDMGHAAGADVAAIGRPVGAHARDLRRKNAQERELTPIETLGDQDGEVAALATRGPYHAVPGGGADRDDLGNGIERGAQILAQRRDDDDAEILAILGDGPAQAVVDRAARGRHEMLADAIVVGEQPIFRRVQDLQSAEAPEEETEEAGLRRADQDRAAREAVAQPESVVARPHVKPR